MPLWQWQGWLLARGGDEGQFIEYGGRLLSALRNAQSAGLHYAHGKKDDGEILCHNCGATLLRLVSPMLHCSPCTMAKEFCPFWRHEEAVTPAGCCMACGAQTPILPMTPEERRRHDAWRAKSDGGVAVRLPLMR